MRGNKQVDGYVMKLGGLGQRIPLLSQGRRKGNWNYEAKLVENGMGMLGKKKSMWYVRRLYGILKGLGTHWQTYN